eukprot:4005286-Pyramimonas_sp.AAC.1
MLRARPPRPRCNAAACCEGVIVPAVTLIQAYSSRANSRKGTWPAGRGPVVLASSPRRMCPTARPIATHMRPKIVTPIQWSRRSWSDVVG